MSDIRKSNIGTVESLLEDPAPDASLDDLKNDLNALARLRNKSRLAFCKRLALVYLMIVGRRQGLGSPIDEKPKEFFLWCRKNIRSATGVEYSTNTLKGYLTVGFAANPEKLIEREAQNWRRRDRKDAKDMKFGRAILKAVEAEPFKPIPVATLKKKYELSGDVASEVRALMDAWDAASQLARRQFLYIVRDAAA